MENKNTKETLRIVTLNDAFTLAGFKDRKRVKFFKKKGITCVSCGCVGVFFAIELDRAGCLSLNLYGIDTNGIERLMTVDHAISKSKGGTDALHNLQPMCEYCNAKKGNKITTSS